VVTEERDAYHVQTLLPKKTTHMVARTVKLLWSPT